MKNIRKIITKKKVMQVLKDNQTVICSLGIMLLVPAVGLANDASSIAITPIQKPMETYVNFLTGPFAGTVTVGSTVAGLASYKLGWEQSFTKKCIGGVVLGAAMTQADSLLSSFGITASSLLF